MCPVPAIRATPIAGPAVAGQLLAHAPLPCSLRMPVLALDAGTTSTRAMVFADDGTVLARAQRPFAQHFPQDGWVEHDAEEIFLATVACAREAIAASAVPPASLAGIGIAVQRETVVVWDRATGQPVYRAIVW